VGEVGAFAGLDVTAGLPPHPISNDATTKVTIVFILALITAHFSIVCCYV